MIATTHKQSQRLLACGVSANKADMALAISDCNILLTAPYPEMRDRFQEKDCFPAWSLTCLLTDILPKHLDNFPFTKWYHPFLEDEIWEMDTPGELNGDVQLSFNGTNWIVDYDWDGFTGHLPQSQNPIEAVVLAIELLHANGYKFD